MVVAGKKKIVAHGVRRSGVSARFDGTSVECEVGKEDVEYFPSSAEGTFVLRLRWKDLH